MHGAFNAVNDTIEVGSPGTIVNPPTTPTVTLTPTITVGASPTITSTATATSTPMDTPVASDDSYTAQVDTTLNVNTAQGLLSNDTGSPLSVVSNTSPAHGTLTLNQDGSFTYIPTNGYTGPDSFSYSISNAVQLYSKHSPEPARHLWRRQH